MECFWFYCEQCVPKVFYEDEYLYETSIDIIKNSYDINQEIIIKWDTDCEVCRNELRKLTDKQCSLIYLTNPQNFYKYGGWYFISNNTFSTIALDSYHNKFQYRNISITDFLSIIRDGTILVIDYNNAESKKQELLDQIRITHQVEKMPRSEIHYLVKNYPIIKPAVKQ
jgi:hypothetical protein